MTRDLNFVIIELKPWLWLSHILIQASILIGTLIELGKNIKATIKRTEGDNLCIRWGWFILWLALYISLISVIIEGQFPGWVWRTIVNYQEMGLSPIEFSNAATRSFVAIVFALLHVLFLFHFARSAGRLIKSISRRDAMSEMRKRAIRFALLLVVYATLMNPAVWWPYLYSELQFLLGR